VFKIAPGKLSVKASLTFQKTTQAQEPIKLRMQSKLQKSKEAQLWNLVMLSLRDLKTLCLLQLRRMLIQAQVLTMSNQLMKEDKVICSVPLEADLLLI